MRRRVLILDFDFHSTVGGGQVFYRRVVERNPGFDFYYPSSGPDLRLRASGKLPVNAHPFAFDARLDLHGPGSANWLDEHYLVQISGIAAAVQGMTFHAVDVPSFFPTVHVVRAVLATYGVQAERIVLGLVGWQTVSVKNGYSETSPDTLAALGRAENLSVESADGRYTISNLEHLQNGGITLPVHLVDMQDAIECFGPPSPDPPGEGPPDLWYVGRLDGAKGPDLFIELVSRMPRALYRQCYLTGPDNTWVPPAGRWSLHLLELARSKGVHAFYEGVLSDDEVRSRVYRGRTVLVVPSRTDAFNFVSLEAVLNACPLLLSTQTGALGFLRTHYPHLAPPEMRPDDLDGAAAALHSILADYDRISRERRQTLLARPFPEPRNGFMEPVYAGNPVHSAEAREQAARSTNELRNRIPLLTDAAMDWRPERPAVSRPRVTVIVPTLDRPALLAPTLASLARQTLTDFEVLVVDDGGRDPVSVRNVAESFAPLVRYVRIANAGEAGAVNRGLALARGEYLGFLSDDDAWAPELLEHALSVLDKRPDLIGAYPDWDIIDTSGYFVEAHRLPEFDRRLMLCAHWCLPGPGVVIRRKVVDAIGGRDLSFRFVSDFDLWLRATAHGPMIHLPEKLAYWRLHTSNLTTSDRRLQMAAERIRLIDKFYLDQNEMARCGTFRHTAYAAAHLAAAAILGDAEADEAMRHLHAAEHLDAGILRNLPPNMSGYPDVWPGGYQVGLRA